METVSVLLEHGADVTSLNKFDKTPIDIACENGFTDILQILEVAYLFIRIFGIFIRYK
jgi:ankyrin repeat protein